MAFVDYREMLDQARGSFIEGDYKTAEPILHQLLLYNSKNPEVYQMLATIYYDKGKFNKAIQTFKKALEIDPTYTDASVGLSIILNDLGRYDEAKVVFLKAESKLEESKKQSDPFLEDKIGQKHQELGDLYTQIHKHDEPLEQYLKAKRYSSHPSRIVLKICESFAKMNKTPKAIQEAQVHLRDYPQDNEVRIKLGFYFYQSNRVFEAVEEWERVLLRDPRNSDAKHYLQLAKETGLTEIATDQELL